MKRLDITTTFYDQLTAAIERKGLHSCSILGSTALDEQHGENVRCAIYARSATTDSCPRSIEEQVRICKKHANAAGWVVLEDFVRADIGVSGASPSACKALSYLLSAARQTPRQFDCVLVTDTARLGRSLVDVLKLCQTLENLGIFVRVAEQNLDSRRPNFRALLTFGSILEEQYHEALRDRIRRGQKGCALHGFHNGGRCYAYRGVRVNPDKNGRNCNPGVRLEVVPKEASVVRRIFQMAALGNTPSQIARSLSHDRVPSPSGGGESAAGSWCPSTVRAILKNEKYRGTTTWNRTRRATDPETGRVEISQRPESEWIKVDVPELRIVSDEDWYKAQRFSFRSLLCCLGCGTRVRRDRTK
jgi:site-specific DNA recombinase